MIKLNELQYRRAQLDVQISNNELSIAKYRSKEKHNESYAQKLLKDVRELKDISAFLGDLLVSIDNELIKSYKAGKNDALRNSNWKTGVFNRSYNKEQFRSMHNHHQQTKYNY